MLDSLPPCLEELAISSWPPGASLAHLTALRILRAAGGMDDAGLATLPPSLVSLDLAGWPPKLTTAAVFPHLPALRVLTVNSTSISDASIASMPAGLEELRMGRCRSVTQRASLDHLTALRVLVSCGTNLPRDTLAACRARECDAPADGILGTNSYTAALAVLPDGRVVNTPSMGCAALWDPAHEQAPVARVQIDLYSCVIALAALPDSRHVAVGLMYKTGGTGGVYLWDTQSHPSLAYPDVWVDTWVQALVVLPDGHPVAAGADGKLYVVGTGTCRRAIVATLEGHTRGVNALAVLPDGSLASASSDGSVRLWDVAARVCIGQLEGHNIGAKALAVLPDGRLACGSGDGAVRLWDVGRRACVGELPVPVPVPPVSGLPVMEGVCALTVLTDNRLASVSQDGALRVWDTHDATAAGVSEGSGKKPVAVVVVSLDTPWYGLSVAQLPNGRVATCGDGLNLWRLPAAT